jgi:hypothetical protein
MTTMTTMRGKRRCSANGDGADPFRLRYEVIDLIDLTADADGSGGDPAAAATEASPEQLAEAAKAAGVAAHHHDDRITVIVIVLLPDDQQKNIKCARFARLCKCSPGKYLCGLVRDVFGKELPDEVRRREQYNYLARTDPSILRWGDTLKEATNATMYGTYYRNRQAPAEHLSLVDDDTTASDLRQTKSVSVVVVNAVGPALTGKQLSGVKQLMDEGCLPGYKTPTAAHYAAERKMRGEE